MILVASARKEDINRSRANMSTYINTGTNSIKQKCMSKAIIMNHESLSACITGTVQFN